jgi:hypothetical protein
MVQRRTWLNKKEQPIGERSTVTDKFAILPELKEFISVVGKYHTGEFIGDQRSALKKYFDFITEEAPPLCPNPLDFLKNKPKTNRLKVITSQHR